MKRIEYLLIILLALIHLVYLYPLVIFPFFRSHDGEVIVARMAAYHKAFEDYHFPPRWAKNFNYNYGSPALNFYYPLPGYVGALIHVAGMSFENSFKLAIGIAFIVSPMTMYLWLRNHLSKKGAFIASLFWGLAPYHFLNLYVRGGLGELSALSIVPLVFWSIDSLKDSSQRLHAIRISLFYGLLILMHNGVSLIFTPIFFLYSLITLKTKRQFSMALVLFVCGLSISAYFWIPVIYDQMYTNVKMFSGQTYKHQFPLLQQLIISDWKFGPNVNESNGLSPQIGIFHIIAVLLSIVYFFKTRKISHKNQTLFWIMIFVFTLLLTISVSKPLWERISLLRQLQFPWRFNAITTLTSSVLAGMLFTFFIKNGRLFFVTTFLFILTSFSYVKIDKVITNSDTYYLTYPSNTDFHGETSSIWTAGIPSEFPKTPVEVISGIAEVKYLKKTTTRHDFTVIAKTDSQVLDNTMYFPGWHVFINNQEIPIEFQNAYHRGLIVFRLPAGIHSIKVLFSETKIRLLANTISVFALVLLLFAFVHYAYQKKFHAL